MRYLSGCKFSGFSPQIAPLVQRSIQLLYSLLLQCLRPYSLLSPEAAAAAALHHTPSTSSPLPLLALPSTTHFPPLSLLFLFPNPQPDEPHTPNLTKDPPLSLSVYTTGAVNPLSRFPQLLMTYLGRVHPACRSAFVFLRLNSKTLTLEPPKGQPLRQPT